MTTNSIEKAFNAIRDQLYHAIKLSGDNHVQAVKMDFTIEDGGERVDVNMAYEFVNKRSYGLIKDDYLEDDDVDTEI